ncbi:TPA: hypothetical protein EYO12_04445 [Candidatus Saccharibacteria bacterium]|nr:hypothetical protein [Candidatus Saccharibacteria bacterium]HIO87715.1 hypothetical protein [Candidatus Saccharibacteria bacterium]
MSNVKMSKTISNKIGYYLLAGLAALFASWYLLYAKQLSTLSENSAEKAFMQQEITELNNLATATQELEANLQSISEEADRALALLPVGVDEDRLLSLMSFFETQSGVIMTSFTPVGVSSLLEGDEESDEPFSTYSVSIGITGTYEELLSFFDLLSNSARFISVDKLSVLGGGTEENPRLSVDIAIEAYFQTDPANSATDDEFLGDDGVVDEEVIDG